MKAHKPTAALVVVGALLTAVAVGLPSPRASSVIYDVVSMAAAVAIFVAVAVRRPGRSRAWICVATGVALFAAGDIVYTAALFSGTEVPFPSPADVFYIGAYPVLTLGLVQFARARGAGRASLLDALIVTLGLGAAVWLSVARPLLADAGVDSLAGAVAIAYPASSVALLAAVSRLILGGGPISPSARILFAGFGFQLVSDAVYAHQSVAGTYQEGGLLDAGWLLAYVCLAAAAVHPSMATLTQRQQASGSPLTRQRFALLMGATMAPPVADLFLKIHPEELVAGAILGLVALVAIRLSLPISTLNDLAHRDRLTGLANRALLMERLEAEIDRTAADREPLAVLLCDLDHFKLVNDGLGHLAGDELLAEVGRRFQSAVRADDTVARLGGDEFCVLLPGADVAAATEVAHRLLAATDESLEVGGYTVHPRVSIGAAARHGRPGTTADLLREADAALYDAKGRGRGQLAWFDDTLQARAVARLELENDLRLALAAGEIECAFQPEVFIGSDSVFGIEALARWTHTTRGPIPPSEFVPVAEQIGLIDDLFDVVLDRALRAQVEWHGQTGNRPAIAVNVSGRQLRGTELADRVRAQLERYGVPADSLWLELTENAIEDSGSAMETLQALRAVGVRLSLDDYGTGWSTLTRLSSLRWDAIKIDRAFTAALGHDDDPAIVRATIAMAHAFGSLVVAEGVETPEQREILAGLGCDIAQGYLVSRPLPAVDMGVWLSERPGPSRLDSVVVTG